MAEKKKKTPEQVYKGNKRKAKLLAILAPVVFWGFIVISVFCVVLAFKHSFGNIAEIMRLLDDKVYTGEQIETNYNFLLNKYGEWTIGSGGYGFTIRFINIGKALFSGLMITNIILAVVFFVSAFVLGKWLLPKIAHQINVENQDMVNLTILKNQENKG